MKTGQGGWGQERAKVRINLHGLCSTKDSRAPVKAPHSVYRTDGHWGWRNIIIVFRMLRTTMGGRNGGCDAEGTQVSPIRARREFYLPLSRQMTFLKAASSPESPQLSLGLREETNR